jgi:hypothetical protein
MRQTPSSRLGREYVFSATFKNCAKCAVNTEVLDSRAVYGETEIHSRMALEGSSKH